MMCRRAATLLLVTAAACTATGCTARQSEAQYEERLQQAVVARDEVVDQVDRRALVDPAAHASAARRLDDVADELDADRPPRSVEAAHGPMVSGLRGLASLLRRLAECAGLEQRSAAAAAGCRERIDQQAFDEVRGDFDEADTIYRETGFSVARPREGGAGNDVPEGGDEL